MPSHTPEELARRKRVKCDAECYHLEFDALLEEKLHSLDPEWIEAMNIVYRDSGLERWYA